MMKDEYLSLLDQLGRVEPTKSNVQILKTMLKSAVLSHTPWQRCDIRCVETGIIYDGVVHAAKALGCTKSAVSNHLYGRVPSIRGVHLERRTITQR